jgi:site-specific DNA-methyltransferase (adenine-specific)
VTVTLYEGDCIAVIPQLVSEGVVVDAVCCDPPYHLTATAKRFSAHNSAPAQWGKDGAMARLSGGFMGQLWDGGDIAFRPETWATIATVLRPGGFLLAFGGTRTFHRLVCAIEDAGFVIQDAIGWLYGSGFPKRRDMLKPAMELICVAYKPGGKRTLQVDECRIEATDNTTKEWRGAGNRSREEYRTGTSGRPIPTDIGRWPANVCHDGSDEVMEAFAAAGHSRSGTNCIKRETGKGHQANAFGVESRPAGTPMITYGDEGSVARFFWHAKADGEDRWGSRHPTVKPVEVLKWLVPLVTPKDGTFLDPFAGSGTGAVAALATGRNAILIERDPGYCSDIRERLAHYEGEGRHSLAARARNKTEKVGTLI